jgi:CheY-like chemotaxis protein
VAATRVLLVDRNDDFLDAFAAWLARSDGLEIAGRAHGGHEAIERVRCLAPDVVVMDLMLPDMTGLEATRRIKAGAAPPGRRPWRPARTIASPSWR